jgi:hypothetical protein
MTSGNAAVETITSDPVIVEVADAQKPVVDVKNEESTAEKAAEKDSPLDEEMRNLGLDNREYRRPVHREPRDVYVRDYSRSRSPANRRRPACDVVLTNSAALNNILNETDACVETVRGVLVYLTTHPFHTADLQKIAWLFTIGVVDGWSQKPTAYLAGNGFQFDMPRGNMARGERNDFYDDGYDLRYGNKLTPVPTARLGAALRILKDDADAAKVKFVIAIQAKNEAGWVKLMVCHSRQAAVAEIFHEILNNHTIAFVGAVLRDVGVPTNNPNVMPKRLQRVGSVKEAEEVDPSVIGVIC